jgi:hypothetical protein
MAEGVNVRISGKLRRFIEEQAGATIDLNFEDYNDQDMFKNFGADWKKFENAPRKNKVIRLYVFSKFLAESPAKLQRFLRHEHQKTTEIYAGHIETGTKKQIDFLADFWADKLDLIEGQEFIPASFNQKK